jgi:GNAT superfamily N-acetyltransferase
MRRKLLIRIGILTIIVIGFCNLSIARRIKGNFVEVEIFKTENRNLIRELKKLFTKEDLPLPTFPNGGYEKGTVVAIDERTQKVIGGFQYCFPIDFDNYEIEIDLTFAVDKDYQKKDIGKKLFLKLIEIMQETRYESFVFTVIKKESLPFWLKMGAKIVNENTLPSGEKTYVMRYILKTLH